MRKLLLILILVQPFFWKNFVFGLPTTIGQYLKTPFYIISQVKNVFSDDSLTPVKEMRWNSRNQNQEFTGRFFFNKTLQPVRELVNSLGNLAPQRIFFGDNQLCWFLIPAVVLGLIQVFKTTPIYIVFFILSPLTTVLTGQPSAIFLLPTLLFYLFFAAKWFQTQPSKIVIPYFILLIISLIFNVR